MHNYIIGTVVANNGPSSNQCYSRNAASFFGKGYSLARVVLQINVMILFLFSSEFETRNYVPKRPIRAAIKRNQLLNAVL